MNIVSTTRVKEGNLGAAPTRQALPPLGFRPSALFQYPVNFGQIPGEGNTTLICGSRSVLTPVNTVNTGLQSIGAEGTNFVGKSSDPLCCSGGAGCGDRGTPIWRVQMEGGAESPTHLPEYFFEFLPTVSTPPVFGTPHTTQKIFWNNFQPSVPARTVVSAGMLQKP